MVPSIMCIVLVRHHPLYHTLSKHSEAKPVLAKLNARTAARGDSGRLFRLLRLRLRLANHQDCHQRGKRYECDTHSNGGVKTVDNCADLPQLCVSRCA